MKTRVILMLIMLAAVMQCSAQQHSTIGLAAARRLTERQRRMLGLSGSQVRRMEPINRDFYRRKDSLNHVKNLSTSARIASYHNAVELRDGAYRNVLSSTQFRNWNDWELQHRKKFKQKKIKRTGHPLLR